MLASAPTKKCPLQFYRSGHFFMNYQSIVQLFRIQPLQHGQHGGGLGAGGNGVHHQVVAALDGGCAGISPSYSAIQAKALRVRSSASAGVRPVVSR